MSNNYYFGLIIIIFIINVKKTTFFSSINLNAYFNFSPNLKIFIKIFPNPVIG